MCVSQGPLRVDLHTSKGGDTGTELQSSENTELILLEDQTIFSVDFFSLNVSVQFPQHNVKRTVCTLKHKRRKYIYELVHIATFEVPRDTSKIRDPCHLWDREEVNITKNKQEPFPIYKQLSLGVQGFKMEHVIQVTKYTQQHRLELWHVHHYSRNKPHTYDTIPFSWPNIRSHVQSKQTNKKASHSLFQMCNSLFTCG